MATEKADQFKHKQISFNLANPEQAKAFERLETVRSSQTKFCTKLINDFFDQHIKDKSYDDARKIIRMYLSGELALRRDLEADNPTYTQSDVIQYLLSLTQGAMLANASQGQYTSQATKPTMDGDSTTVKQEVKNQSAKPTTGQRPPAIKREKEEPETAPAISETSTDDAFEDADDEESVSNLLNGFSNLL